ncbi:MAG: Holliday junction resolvase RuvX [bacterium]
MPLTRYLGLDVGTKRIGISISDPLFIIAQPLKTIFRHSEQQSIEEIENLCKEYNVSVIIIGLPKNMNGTLGPQAQDVQFYAELIKEKIKVDIVFEDERLTSKDAERILIEQNKKPSRNKELVDVVSAVLILQQYLDKRRQKKCKTLV